MNSPSPRERLESALQESEPANAVVVLAKTLKNEGMTQAEMIQLYDEYRAKHQGDTDEAMYNAILDSMDYISGWCIPSLRLFDTELPPDAT